MSALTFAQFQERLASGFKLDATNVADPKYISARKAVVIGQICKLINELHMCLYEARANNVPRMHESTFNALMGDYPPGQIQNVFDLPEDTPAVRRPCNTVLINDAWMATLGTKEESLTGVLHS